MQIKRVKCPRCGIVLDVSNSKNEKVKIFSCPSCKANLQITFPPQQNQNYIANGDGATQLGGSNDGATMLAPQNENAKKNSPKLVFDDLSYPLKEGQNIIGRKGTTSKATIQIETADRYMSRQHCSISVTTLPDGTQKAVLSNYLNKNQTSVNDQIIGNGDEIRLTNGDSIKMGHTTVVFKL